MFLLDYEVQMPPFKAKSSLEITADATSDQEKSRDRGTRILWVLASVLLPVFL